MNNSKYLTVGIETRVSNRNSVTRCVAGRNAIFTAISNLINLFVDEDLVRKRRIPLAVKFRLLERSRD